MDQTNHQFACDLSLDALVANALTELERLGYSRRSLRRYRCIWQRLISSQSATDVQYSEDLGARFVETHRIHDGEPVAPQDRWRRHVVFAVKVLGTCMRKHKSPPGQCAQPISAPSLGSVAVNRCPVEGPVP